MCLGKLVRRVDELSDLLAIDVLDQGIARREVTVKRADSNTGCTRDLFQACAWILSLKTLLSLLPAGGS